MDKKIIFVFVVSVLAVLLSLGCMAKRNIGVAMDEGVIETYQWNVDVSENADDQIEDARITSMVKMELGKDESVSSSNINVDTTNGSVTLNGKVNSQTKADRAVEIARSIKGVKRVRSKLVVEK